MVAQVYFYFTAYKKWVLSHLYDLPLNFILTREYACRDRNWLTCLVIFLFLADTVNVALDLVYVYDTLIINFGK